jgi:hypothetical protein
MRFSDECSRRVAASQAIVKEHALTHAFLKVSHDECICFTMPMIEKCSLAHHQNNEGASIHTDLTQPAACLYMMTYVRTYRASPS